MGDSQTVLVVGGAGYIGSHAARMLRKHGYEAIIYDNLSTGHEFLANGFRLIVADAGDAAQIRTALRGVKAVMYFAAHAYVGESVWENVVTSCAPCNLRKGDRSLEQVGMELKTLPRPPAPALFIRLAAPRIPSGWTPYLPGVATA